MRMPAIVTDRKAREEFKDKVEVVMAVFVLMGFAYKKLKGRNAVPTITNLQEKA